MQHTQYQIDTKKIEEYSITLSKIIIKISYHLLIYYQHLKNDELDNSVKIKKIIRDLDIDEDLIEFYIEKLTEFYTLGRFDWIIDNKNGQLKCIEFNAETPAFQVESIRHNEFFYRRWVNYYDDLYKYSQRILHKEDLNIICICDMHDDDEIRDTVFLENCFSHKIKLIDTVDFYKQAKFINGKVLLNEKEIDVVWHPNTPLHEINRQIPSFSSFLKETKDTVFWNSPISSLYSSKYLYAYMHLLLKNNSNILNEQEKLFIKRHIPYTTTNIDDMNSINSKLIIKKPVIGSCGEDVTIENIQELHCEDGFIYQEHIEQSLLDGYYLNLISFVSVLNDVDNINFLGYGFKISEDAIVNDNCEFLSAEEYHSIYKLRKNKK